MKKALFTFTKDGVSYVDPNLGEWDAEFTAKMLDARNKHYTQQSPREREWRNREFSKTDWMLIPDATYGGEPLTGSQYLEDIKVYRQALRDYNLTTDDRPERPDWFN